MYQQVNQFYALYQKGAAGLTRLHSAVALAARLYIAQVFFSAGLTKIQDWDTTLFLFEEEYHVPFLSFELAAYLATIGELVLPLLLFVGLLSRFSALGLSVVNVVAVISLIEIAPAALYLHVVWGLLLAQVAIYGGGFLALDRPLEKYFRNRI
jgi:putative oxidoreductase